MYLANDYGSWPVSRGAVIRRYVWNVQARELDDLGRPFGGGKLIFKGHHKAMTIFYPTAKTVLYWNTTQETIVDWGEPPFRMCGRWKVFRWGLR